MKKLLSISLFVMMCISVNAQSTGSTLEEKAIKSTEILTKKLGLNTKQKAKLLDINNRKFEEFVKIEEKMANEPIEKRYEKMNLTVRLDKELYPLLEKSQIKTLKALRKKQVAQIQN